MARPDIKAKIEAAAPTGVSVDIEESISDGQSIFRLRINGTTTAVDANNVLSTLQIDNVDTTGAILREVDEGSRIQINVEGRDLFEGAQNVFSAFLNLRDSVNTYNVVGIRESITDLEAASEKVSDVRGVLGARTNRVELSRALLERFEVSLNSSLGDAEDADLAQTVLDLQSEQTKFTAALMAGGSILQQSLFDFLR